MAQFSVIPPQPTADDQYFWTGVANDTLLLRCCGECGRIQHPPTPLCPKCGCGQWRLRESAGTGTVLSWIVSKGPDATDDDGRIVAVIDLPEGVRIVSNLVEIDAAEVAVGLDVQVTFADVQGVRLPQFRPTPAGGSHGDG
ncbi:Zn-ribbon domain-containing OB-fold protein [Mycobacterium sp. 94-17]|uniref:Zn-ribbon domain-containing OB-fold protein n=1 Tax=Mycobacterium sp. 94-17 TaxID=2986147 RepID=UPI002D1E7412|nr:OB-fold domain-containing protein [Mycobacterium sp. 94-17]MEB4209777.1 OB-fold domain-containing protein [Mycobacterium sp. 94-17]